MYLLITVDAEAVHGNSPLDDMMWGRLKGFDGEYGIGLIADVCEKYNMKATFFLDVYEHSYYGKHALKEVATYLDHREHDVQLHTHPAWYQDKRDFKKTRQMKKEQSCFPVDKYWMNLNTLEDQVQILNHGKELLEDWLGKPVIAHRAGSYALDINTIYALQAVGIPVDSSMFYGHPHSKVTWSKNKLVEKHGVFEAPVTMFWRNTKWHWGGYVQDKGPQPTKTDINWCSLDELKYFVLEGKKNALPIINLFLHSYSFIKYDRYFINFAPNRATIEKFFNFLDFCASDREIKNVSLYELWQLYREKKITIDGDDFVPVVEDRYINVYSKAIERLFDESRRIVHTFTGHFVKQPIYKK